MQTSLQEKRIGRKMRRMVQSPSFLQPGNNKTRREIKQLMMETFKSIYLHICTSMQTLIFGALAENSRIAIAKLLLKKKNATCCEIAKAIGKDSSTTFRHLEILERAKIIKTEKEGRKLVCSIYNPIQLKKILLAAEKIG